MRLLPCGDRAWLVELPDAATRRHWDEALRANPIAGVLEHVPAARTIGVLLDGSRPLAEVAADLRALEVGQVDEDATSGPVVEVEVVYDGPDLAEVCALRGWSADDLVVWHTSQAWTCDFVGFLPGFGYLLGDGEPLAVPRRTSPRPRVPAGSVALAGDFCAVYPQASPGGWQLVGRTEAVLFDVTREPASLLASGTRVRFVDAGGRR
ncbi:5-oxoprolinase subunit B family protein [Aestuariimicrobium ganziense]|uniref:5-oxoprolinase subunit B family protein n=1 Tax=Aestuariimicrobium ganziense TaxID=2773677 RepID=UPI001940E5C5|nr:allophanate hydrolase subunit 1 [Aestuariimicrobium ganziense]